MTTTDAWRPIAEAPKDGTSVLLWVPTFGGGASTVGYWDDDKYRKAPKPMWFYERAHYRLTEMRQSQPTHWQPLPPPPSATG